MMGDPLESLIQFREEPDGRLTVHPAPAGVMACLCLRVDANGYYICDRTDPHPDEFGSDSEGHRWVPVTREWFAQLEAALASRWPA